MIIMLAYLQCTVESLSTFTASVCVVDDSRTTKTTAAVRVRIIFIVVAFVPFVELMLSFDLTIPCYT